MKEGAALVNHRTWWATVTAVLWAFLGVRRKSDFEDDIGSLTPLQIVIVGALGGLLFVLVLVLVVKWVLAAA